MQISRLARLIEWGRFRADCDEVDGRFLHFCKFPARDIKIDVVFEKNLSDANRLFLNGAEKHPDDAIP